MTLEELKDAWQEEANAERREGPPPEAELRRARKDARSFHRTIRRRDWLETVAAAAGAIPFVLVLVRGSWLARTGAAVVLLSAIFIVWRLHSVRRRHETPEAGAPVTQALRVELRRLDAQIGLLEGVFRWYLAPLDLGLVLTVAGTMGMSPEAGWYLLGVAVLNLLVWWLNRRKARRELEPRRARVFRLLEQLGE